MLRMSLYTYIPIYIRSTHAGLSCYSITRNHINPMNSLSTSQSWPILTGFLIFKTENATHKFVHTDRKKKVVHRQMQTSKKKTEKHIKNTLTHSPGSLAMMVYSIFDGDDNDADETKTKPTTNQ